MLHLPLKGSKDVDLAQALFRFVENTYSKAQATKHRQAFADPFCPHV